MNNSYQLAVFTGEENENYSNKGKQLFRLMLSLRENGYKSIHGDQINIKDNLDKSSTHLFLYQELKNKIEPLACIRIIHSNYCTNAVFPPLVNLQLSKNFQAYYDTYEFIKNLKKEDLETTYDDMFTVSPKRRKKGESLIIMNSIMSTVFYWHKENNITSFITSATYKVKTDKLFYRLGFDKISQNSEYILPSINSEKAVMLKFINKPTSFSQRIASDYKSIWNNKIEYVGKLVASTQKIEGI